MFNIHQHHKSVVTGGTVYRNPKLSLKIENI